MKLVHVYSREVADHGSLEGVTLDLFERQHYYGPKSKRRLLLVVVTDERGSEPEVLHSGYHVARLARPGDHLDPEYLFNLATDTLVELEDSGVLVDDEHDPTFDLWASRP